MPRCKSTVMKSCQDSRLPVNKVDNQVGKKDNQVGKKDNQVGKKDNQVVKEDYPVVECIELYNQEASCTEEKCYDPTEQANDLIANELECDKIHNDNSLPTKADNNEVEDVGKKRKRECEIMKQWLHRGTTIIYHCCEHCQCKSEIIMVNGKVNHFTLELNVTGEYNSYIKNKYNNATAEWTLSTFGANENHYKLVKTFANKLNKYTNSIGLM